MVFTVNSGGGRLQTFDGFCMVTCENTSTRPLAATFLAVVSFEGDIDLYWLEDDSRAVEELQRMYRSEFGREAKINLFKPTNS